MSDEPTCGKGLAEHSALPKRLSELTAAMADVLQDHQRSLDADEPNGRAELDAYKTLTSDFRDIATALEKTAARMAGYRDLPMARHDESALMSSETAEAFKRFIQAERELLQLMRTSVERDEAMLSGND